MDVRERGRGGGERRDGGWYRLWLGREETPHDLNILQGREKTYAHYTYVHTL